MGVGGGGGAGRGWGGAGLYAGGGLGGVVMWGLSAVSMCKSFRQRGNLCLGTM